MVYPEGTLNDVNSATLVPDPAEKVTPYKNKTYDNYEVCIKFLVLYVQFLTTFG